MPLIKYRSTPALWKPEDNCVTWTQVGTQFPTGWPDYVVSVNGDMNVYNQSMSGSQAAAGRSRWLATLKSQEIKSAEWIKATALKLAEFHRPFIE